jgi:3-phenylpropionate/cinnamic acid dioxygenase small subunit
MSKIKRILEEDMAKYPELYNGEADYEFWMKCREEKLLERENKPTIKIIRKGKSNVRKRKKSS